MILTINEIKTAIITAIPYANSEDVNDAAQEIFDMLQRANKVEPKLVNNDDENR